jgi:hypothetical protein
MMRASLFLDEDGSAVSRSAHLPIRLRRADGGIAGEIAHVPRRFAPIERDAALSRSWEGEWVCEQYSARCSIMRVDGGGRLSIGTGPLRISIPLTPLDAHRALTDRREGPWRQRACLVLNPRANTLRMVTNRSRVLHFRKA